ncbi:(2Fe-2S)-binding protein [Jannaschia aquimarina]|uniref:(2Fe-2S)-binding protein n=1 Tax=Jannaschia aquimarina TaxID=935700 RepID=UPI001F446215|nr:(2Fe-2S)-binding protein [Jannaschia aquimarina]
MLKGSAGAVGGLAAGAAMGQGTAAPASGPTDPRDPLPFEVTLNGELIQAAAEPRETLLDWLRETRELTGTKVGCNHGQCGACTVHVDGEPRLACLTLALQVEGREVTTIEGLARIAEAGGYAEDGLHPMQTAFVANDALQCGYCTPGQIMSAVAVVNEGHASDAAEVREYMSGNLCRCAAYPNITAAVLDAKERMPDVAVDGGGARQDFHLGSGEA